MNFTRTSTKTIELGTSVFLEDLAIGNHAVTLKITNDHGTLTLGFNNGDVQTFTITIDRNGGMQLSRILPRPKHDHDDCQYLVYRESTPEDALPFWSSRFPYVGEGRDFFTINILPEVSEY